MPITLDDCQRLDLRPVFQTASRYPDPAHFVLEIRRSRTPVVVDLERGRLNIGPVTMELVRSAQRFGGSRVWARCPSCARRLAVLYRRPWSAAWTCRVCTRLPYASAVAGPVKRAKLRMLRLRRRLVEAESGGARASQRQVEQLRARALEAERSYLRATPRWLATARESGNGASGS